MLERYSAKMGEEKLHVESRDKDVLEAYKREI
jgi:hypothetical protein